MQWLWKTGQTRNIKGIKYNVAHNDKVFFFLKIHVFRCFYTFVKHRCNLIYISMNDFCFASFGVSALVVLEISLGLCY